MRKLPDGAAAEADKAVNAVLKYPGAKWSLAVKNRRAILLAVGPPQAAPREWIIGYFPPPGGGPVDEL